MIIRNLIIYRAVVVEISTFELVENFENRVSLQVWRQSVHGRRRVSGLVSTYFKEWVHSVVPYYRRENARQQLFHVDDAACQTWRTSQICTQIQKIR